MLFHLGEVLGFKSYSAIYFSVRIGSFRKEIHSVDVGAKAEVLSLLSYLGRGNVHTGLYDGGKCMIA